MLLAAGLATYAGTTIAGMGLHRSPWTALPFGLFYAAVIFFFDRSVLLTSRPYRLRRDGTVRSGRSGPATAIRILVAVCAALLVGETLLLQIFAPSIEPRVTQLRQEDLTRSLRAWDAAQQDEQRTLATALTGRQHALDAARAVVTTTTSEVNCQLTGGQSCLPGQGPVYQIKIAELGAANAAVATAVRERDAAAGRLDTFEQSRDTRREGFRDQQNTVVNAADDLLIREKAFWRLTAADRSVLVWRLVLSLLLLGVDLGPLAFRRTLEQTDLGRRDRLAQWRAGGAEEVDAQQIGQTTRHRVQLARVLADSGAERYEQYVRRREEIDASGRLSAELADAEVTRAQVRLARDSRIRDLHLRYRLPSPQQPPGPPAALDPPARMTENR